MDAMNKKLHGASLLETVVALTIMLMVILLSLRFIVQITLNSDRAMLIRAECLLGKEAIKSKQEKIFLNQSITEDPEIRVERIMENYEGESSVKLMKLEAYDKENVKLAEYKILVRDE